MTTPASLPIIRFSLREVCQTASANHLVAYTATLILTPKTSNISIQIASRQPKNSEPDLLELALQATREGFTEVLTPLGLGANASITQLILHPVDFSSFHQRHYSAQYLRAALVNAGIIET